MPKKSRLTPKGRAFLRGGKKKKGVGLSPRPFFKKQEISETPIVVDGHQLNRPESKFYKLLRERGEQVLVQKTLFAFGGFAKPDFLLPQRRTIIEVDGSFHGDLVGKAKDFIRDERRRQAGYHVLHIPVETIDNNRGRQWLQDNLRF